MKTLVLIVALVIAAPVQAGQFTSLITDAFSSTPTPPTPSSVCDNCDGTGKLGDGTITVPCPVCGGDGKLDTVAAQDATPSQPVAADLKGPDAQRRHDAPAAGVILADDLTADQQPTPMEGVAAGLRALNPQPGETYADLGCGFDARWSITAAKLYPKLKIIAVEKDARIAESARLYIEHAGLADRIQLVIGDAADLYVTPDIASAYLWPETLERLRPKIEQLKRFVSYGFAVPGLRMDPRPVSNGGTIYVWEQPPAVTQVPITRTYRQTVRLPSGSYCQICGRHCSNPMAHRLQQQIVGYQTVLSPPAQVAPDAATSQRPAPAISGHYETRCYYDRLGRRHCQRVWVQD